MDIDLTGRTALVTGSTAGIGEAIARGLAGAGAQVVVNGRTQERVDQAVESIAAVTGAGDRVRGVAADVATAEGCDALIEAEPDVDVLVNNAATFEMKPVFEITDDDWRRYFDTNVMSGIRLARHHIPRMVDRGWGRAIFISSESALHIPAEMVHYGMTKTAQLAISRGMAESVPGTGVTVNSVLPGPTLSEAMTGMLEDSVQEGESFDDAARRFIAEQRPTSLLGRPTSTDEVANLVVYVASGLSSGTSGAALRVDGGVVRAIP
jgi:NAD(P)-dependent dehydrogenase (short-subunit alcohol dehydrogenase family)